MKQLSAAFLLVLFLVAASSCRKERTCHCTDSDPARPLDTTFTFDENLTYYTAKGKCNAFEFGPTVECEAK